MKPMTRFLSMWLFALLVLCRSAFGQTAPPVLTTAPGTHLEIWTNGRYIIRDNTGRQVGTVEPYFNGWIIRDTMGRETGRMTR